MRRFRSASRAAFTTDWTRWPADDAELALKMLTLSKSALFGVTLHQTPVAEAHKAYSACAPDQGFPIDHAQWVIQTPTVLTPQST